MERKTLYVLFSLIALIGVSTVSFMLLSHREVVPTTPSAKDLRGRALFTDGEYGLSIQYPEKFQTDYTFASYYHLPAYWRVNALNEGTGTPIIAIVGMRTESDHSYPRYYDAEIRISASKDPKEIARCEKPGIDSGETQLPDVALNGTTFKAFSFESAGMMQYLKGISYRTVHDGACIVIEQLATGSHYHDDPKSNEDISDKTLDAAYQSLAEFVKTFSFAGS